MIYRVWWRRWCTGGQEVCVLLRASLQTHCVTLFNITWPFWFLLFSPINRLTTSALPIPGLWTFVDEVGCAKAPGKINGALQICSFTIKTYRVLRSSSQPRQCGSCLWFISLWVFGFVSFLMTLSLCCIDETCRPSDSTADHLSLYLTISPDSLLLLPCRELGRGGSGGEVTFIEHFMWVVLLNLPNTPRRRYYFSFPDELICLGFRYVPCRERETFSSS